MRGAHAGPHLIWMAACAGLVGVEARACPPADPGAELRAPASWQRDSVPRNVVLELLAHSEEEARSFEQVELVPVDAPAGTPGVPVRLEPLGELPAGYPRARLQPAAPLAAETAYWVYGGVLAPAKLRTGRDEDHVPPPAPFGLSARMAVYPRAECSFPGRLGELTFSLPEPGEPVRYRVRENGQVVVLDLAPSPSAPPRAYVACDATGPMTSSQMWLLTPGPHTLEFTAVDLAGNASEPVSLRVEADCSLPLTLEPGPVPGGPPDAGTGMPYGDDFSFDPAPRPSGCGGSSGVSTVLGVMLFALAWRRTSSP